MISKHFTCLKCNADLTKIMQLQIFLAEEKFGKKRIHYFRNTVTSKGFKHIHNFSNETNFSLSHLFSYKIIIPWIQFDFTLHVTLLSKCAKFYVHDCICYWFYNTIHLQGFLLNWKCGDDYANFCVHLCNSISTLACTTNYGDTVRLYFLPDLVNSKINLTYMTWHNFKVIFTSKVGHKNESII